MTPEIGQKIREARKRQGLTQEQLAEQVHVSRQTVSHWENGRAEPNYETLKALAETLEIDLVPFFQEEQPAKAEPEEDVKSVELPVQSRKQNPRIRLLLIGIIMLLCIVPVISRFASKESEHSLKWFGEEQIIAEDQANICIYTHDSPIQMIGSGDSGKWEFSLFFKEQNGIGIEVQSLHFVWFKPNGRSYIEKLSGEEFRSHTGSTYIGANEIRFMNIGKPSKYNFALFGCALEGVDDLGNNVVFRMTVPLAR